MHTLNADQGGKEWSWVTTSLHLGWSLSFLICKWGQYYHLPHRVLTKIKYNVGQTLSTLPGTQYVLMIMFITNDIIGQEPALGASEENQSAILSLQENWQSRPLSLQTIQSAPAFPKGFLLMIKPHKCPMNITHANPKGSHQGARLAPHLPARGPLRSSPTRPSATGGGRLLPKPAL